MKQKRLEANFTTREIQFFAFRHAVFLGAKIVFGVHTEEEVWELMPDFGFYLSTAWNKMTGQNGVEP